MLSVYVVSHPEATHAVEGLVGGWYDSDLTPRGSGQAGRIADSIAARVRTEGVMVISSDLRRTRRTAEAIAAPIGAEVVLDDRLREQSYGAAEGLPVGTVPYAAPPSGGDRLRHHDGVVGSETRLDVAARVYAAMDRVLAAGTEHVVVVTHSGAATYLLAAWIGMSLDSLGSVRFAVSPGSISVLREDDDSYDRWIVSLNEVGHLG